MAGSAKITVSISGDTLKGPLTISRSMSLDLGVDYEQSVRALDGTPKLGTGFTPRLSLYRNIGDEDAVVTTRTDTDVISTIGPGEIAMVCGETDDLKIHGGGFLEVIAMAEIAVPEDDIGGEGGSTIIGEGGEPIIGE